MRIKDSLYRLFTTLTIIHNNLLSDDKFPSITIGNNIINEKGTSNAKTKLIAGLLHAYYSNDKKTFFVKNQDDVKTVSDVLFEIWCNSISHENGFGAGESRKNQNKHLTEYGADFLKGKMKVEDIFDKRKDNLVFKEKTNIYPEKKRYLVGAEGRSSLGAQRLNNYVSLLISQIKKDKPILKKIIKRERLI